LSSEGPPLGVRRGVRQCQAGSHEHVIEAVGSTRVRDNRFESERVE
jgi:hypothetical protein